MLFFFIGLQKTTRVTRAIFLKRTKKGVFFAKNSLLVVYLTSVGRIHKRGYPSRADDREISESMFAVQENIMSMYACV